MKIKFIYFAAIIFLITSPLKAQQIDKETQLWLARSCIGEARWNSHETGECATILHIYKKLATRRNKSILSIAKAYSAAIKKYKRRPNPWILHLNREATQPKKWPKNTKWKWYHKYHWLQTLFYVNLFLKGKIPDPYPEAIGYGAKIDIPPKYLKKIKTNFRNVIYKERWKR